MKFYMWSNMLNKKMKRQDGKLNKMQLKEEKEKDNKKRENTTPKGY